MRAVEKWLRVERNAVLDLEIVGAAPRVAERRVAPIELADARDARGPSVRVNDAGRPACEIGERVEGERAEQVGRLILIEPSRRSSLVSLRRCLLFVLNHDSWFRSPTPSVVWRVFSDSDCRRSMRFCTPLVPSSKIEFTRTVPARHLRDTACLVPRRADAERSLAQNPMPKYDVWRPCTSAAQFVRSPLCAGSSRRRA